MQTKEIENIANQEKGWAALTSVLAAIFLTLLKITVGIMTNSLGILAEAAHSGLDLMAALVTLLAVRFSGRPADRAHTYGHGKIENLSALFETVLLLVTCGWIVYEAVVRLFFRHVVVEVTVWSFLVMAMSILIDISRSRMLKRVAKKYQSQALEADALHFSTDIWSSTVVIGGLALILISRQFQILWLAKADALAAMLVAGIVVHVSLQLGRRAVAEMIDEVPETLQDEIAQTASRLPGVQKVRDVRVRRTGAKYFVDLTASVDRSLSSEKTHEISMTIEEAIKMRLPGATMMIHMEPVQVDNEQLADFLRVLATRYDLGVHHIHIFDTNGINILTVHLDVQEDLQLGQAYDLAKAFENDVLASSKNIQKVLFHVEPAYRQRYGTAGAHEYQDEDLEQMILKLSNLTDPPCFIHNISILARGKKLAVSFQCALPGESSVVSTHELTVRMEESLLEQVPDLEHVLIQVEPTSS